MSLNTFVWLVILVVLSGPIIAFVRAFLGKPPAEHKPPFWYKTFEAFADAPRTECDHYDETLGGFWDPQMPGGFRDWD